MSKVTIKEISRMVIEEVKQNGIKSYNDLQKIKHRISREHKSPKFPTNIELLCSATNKEYHEIKKLLTLKPTRTLSGVAPVAVMAKPYACPHGKCIFCPGGVDSAFGDTPQSYTGHEPSTMRSMRAGYDPYLIVLNRLEQYAILGHEFDKVDIIIQSGTFCYFNKAYQKQLIKYIFKALNDFSKLFIRRGEFDFDLFKEFFELPADITDEKRAKRITRKMKKLKSLDCAKLTKKQIKNLLDEKDLQKATISIDEEHKYNDKKSNVKCVGLTVETRPDWGRQKHGEELLKLGVTRIELGIQSVYDEILKFIERGHDVKEIIDSVRELKDLGFKLNFHYMPGLCNEKKDKEGMEELFSNPNFRPDMLKLYPCMVMPGTKLEKMYKAGKFKPITTKKATKIIADFMKTIPTYCRIMRVQRDIPTKKIIAGVDKTNLRQLVDKQMVDKKIKSNEIRARESSRVDNIGKPSVNVLEYESSNGVDYFISYDDDNSLFGFCRLRFPSNNNSIAFVRELHVYGRATKVGSDEKESSQHKGIGKKLMQRAEKLARGRKIKVISGVGVREYYRKLGYKLEDTYMVKKL